MIEVLIRSHARRMSSLALPSMDELENSQTAERIVIVRPVLHDLAARSYFEQAWPAPDQLYNYPPEHIMKTYQTVLIGGLMALGLAACSSTGTSGSDMSSGSTSSGSSMSSGSTHTGTSTAASDNGADNNAGAGASNNATNTGTPTAPSTATSTSGGANR
jgi:hypothetical protein